MKRFLVGAAFAALVSSSAFAGAARIEVHPAAGAQHGWRLVGGNGEKMCHSENLKGGPGKVTGAAEMGKATGMFAKNYVEVKGRDGFHYNVVAPSNKGILCTSEAYTSAKDCARAAKAAQAAFKHAKVVISKN